MAVRINVGCGASPTDGWQNFDNSLTVRLAGVPLARYLIPDSPFAAAAKRGDVRYASALSLPVGDASAEVVYSSHMLEHLDRDEAKAFLAECRRVLQPGGVLRLAVPDLRLIVDEYLSLEDADNMIHRTSLGRMRPIGLRSRIKSFVVGERSHMWMYDGHSLARLVEQSGFDNPEIMAPGMTRIPDPGPLDLEERCDESVYVEAVRPVGESQRTT